MPAAARGSRFRCLDTEDEPEVIAASVEKRPRRPRRRADSAPGHRGQLIARRPAKLRIMAYNCSASALSSRNMPSEEGGAPQLETVLEEEPWEADRPAKSTRASSAPPAPGHKIQSSPTLLHDASEWPSLRAAVVGWDFCSDISEAVRVNLALSRQVSGASSSADTLSSSWVAPSEVSEVTADSWTAVQVKPRGRRAGAVVPSAPNDEDDLPSYAQLVRQTTPEGELQRPPEIGCRHRAPPPTRRRHNKLQGVLSEEQAAASGYSALQYEEEDDGFDFLGDSRTRGWNKGHKASHSVKSKMKVQEQSEKRAAQAEASRAANRRAMGFPDDSD